MKTFQEPKEALELLEPNTTFIKSAGTPGAAQLQIFPPNFTKKKQSSNVKHNLIPKLSSDIQFFTQIYIF
jgi:hypothetical protein